MNKEFSKISLAHNQGNKGNLPEKAYFSDLLNMGKSLDRKIVASNKKDSRYQN